VICGGAALPLRGAANGKIGSKATDGDIGKRRAQPVWLAIRTEWQFPAGDLSSSVFKGASMKYSVVFKWTAACVVIAACE